MRELDHPLISREQTALRKRVVQFLKMALSVQRTSNIIFLCGGNDETHMRMCFKEYCKDNLPEYDVFLPESAMGGIFSDGLEEPFDLADFEELVGEVSHAIVVFPEGPGSCAETGYFSAIQTMAQKCILVLDHNRQKDDSFISLGPAKKISDSSIFYPTISLDYSEPNFDDIAERVRIRKTRRTKKLLKLEKFSDLSTYEIAATLDAIVRICTIATYEDIRYLMASIFRNQYSAPKVRKTLCLLLGSEYLTSVGQYGHLASNLEKTQLATVRDGFKTDYAELRLQLTAMYQDCDEEFLQLIEAS